MGGRRAAALRPDARADEIVDFLLDEKQGGIEIWQIEEEFKALAQLVELRRPKAVLEIGTADGERIYLDRPKVAPQTVE